MKDGKKPNQEKKGKQPSTKEGRWEKRITVISVIALLLAVGLYFLVQGIVKNPNRSAAKAAKSTFLSTYNVKYEEFVKSTIYNENCQKKLHMEIFGELEQIEDLFGTMEGEKSSYKMTVDKATATEYRSGDETFTKTIALFKMRNPETDTSAIDRVAVTEVQYRLTYTEDGETEQGTETYYVFRVGGKWYCHPMLSIAEEVSP